MTAILRRITERIEAIPSEVWEAGQAERNPLWQALDDIDDIIAEHDIGDLVRRAVGLENGSEQVSA